MYIPSSNSTVLIENATYVGSTATDHQFSRLNVIGTFIALQLCQLTQPYGSLLFRGHGEAFWRCNPLASFTEACIIFWHLGVVAIQSRKEQPRAILRKLQAMSSSLLMLRGTNHKSESIELAERSTVENHAETTGSTISPGQPAGVTTDSIDASGTVTHRTQVSEVSQQAQDITTTATAAVSTESASPSHETLGVDALARKTLRIDVFTAFTEFIMFLKLIATQGCGWFTAAGLFLILGWFAVQILLLLLHHKEMDEADMASSIEATKDLDVRLKKQRIVWLLVFAALHLPFFGYSAYLASFHPWFPEDTKGLIGALRDCGLNWEAWSQSWVTVGTMVVLGAPLFLSNQAPELILALPVVLLGYIWLFVALFSSSQQACLKMAEKHPSWIKNCVGNSSTIFEPNTFLYYIVDRGLEKYTNAVWLLFFLILISSVYFVFTIPLIFEDNRDIELFLVGKVKWSSLGNAVFVLVVFMLYVVWYDASNTYKPTWVDVLG